MVFPAPATIPARVLAWLVANEELGELHITLAPTAVWRPPMVPDPRPDQAAEWLTKLGWRDRTGGLEREVAASLTVLCQPAEEMYGWITHEGVTIGVLTARIGKDAVLAVRTPDDMIGLSTIPAGRLAERLVAQTPHIPAAPSKPLSVSPAEVRSVNGKGRQLGPAGATVRRARLDARQVKRLLAQPRTGGGELWAAVRDSAGTRHTSTAPLRYADIRDGRHLIIAHGTNQVRLIPAGRVQLVAALNEARRILPVRPRR